MGAESQAPARVEPSEFEASLYSWRAALTRRTARVLAVTAGLALISVIASFLPEPAPLHVWIVVVCYAVGVLGMWLARRSPRVRAIAMFLPFIVLAPFLFVGVGLAASAFLSLTMSTVLVGVLVGPRTAAAFIALSLIAITIGAWPLVARVVPLGAPSAADPHSVSSWPSSRTITRPGG